MLLSAIRMPTRVRFTDLDAHARYIGAFRMGSAKAGNLRSDPQVRNTDRRHGGMASLPAPEAQHSCRSARTNSVGLSPANPRGFEQEGFGQRRGWDASRSARWSREYARSLRLSLRRSARTHSVGLSPASPQGFERVAYINGVEGMHLAPLDGLASTQAAALRAPPLPSLGSNPLGRRVASKPTWVRTRRLRVALGL